ncbi:4-hydroxyphenylacetate 3-hydroxylase C-terminal domain-containing protein [Sinomonas halotolerans]|uniref:4-hydroxyphenylacetate 3-hydroxylase C-terminal domain-containing protein n=1 Tax=Sinomonas halotolerans TaxID=1644133 RepID=A0ABU9WZ33_9MICC
MFMSVGYPRVKEIVEQDVASGVIYLNLSALRFNTPEIRPYLDTSTSAARKARRP